MNYRFEDLLKKRLQVHQMKVKQAIIEGLMGELNQYLAARDECMEILKLWENLRKASEA